MSATCGSCGKSYPIDPAESEEAFWCLACGAEIRPGASAAGQAAAGASLPEEPPIRVLDEAPEEGRLRCGGCGHYYPASIVICTRCGLNLVTGERLSGETGDDDADAAARPSFDPFDWFTSVFPGFFMARTLVFSGLLVVLSIVCFGLAFVLFSLGVVFTAVAAGAVGLLLYGQAIVFLLLGQLVLIQEGLAEFDGARWNVFLVLLFAPAAIIIFIAWRIANATR